jgi:hypothetical protein
MELSNQPCAVMSIIQKQREKTATRVQDILTAFGCNIRVRLGLHEVSPDFCSPQGLILLVVCGDDKQVSDLAGQLSALPDVKVQTMPLEE